MGKARSTREGFDDDERVALLSTTAELLFRKMIHKADDWGRDQAAPRTLLRRYAGKPDAPTEEQIADALEELERATVIRRYQKRGLSYAWIPGWFDEGCPWYQHLTQRARPLHPGPDDPEDPQMDLPIRQEGATRGKRERAERGQAGDEGPQEARGGAPARDAGDAVPLGGGGDRAGGLGARDGRGGADRGGGTDGACREAAGPDAERGDVDGAGERAGQGAGPEEPAQGDVQQGYPRSTRGVATSPPAVAGATSSAAPPAAAGGLLAPLALAIFAEEAGPRWAPGKRALTTTGLDPEQERRWLEAWVRARDAGNGERELRQLGRAVREGRVWRGPPLSPGKLSTHLLDLLAEAAAGGTVEGTRNRPSWRSSDEEKTGT